MKRILIFCLLFSALSANAQNAGSWFLTPTIGVGVNRIQKTYVHFGLDLGMWWDENIFGGVSGFYAAGAHPEHDREVGGGPFVGYVYPLASFLSVQLREDIPYVDQRQPVLLAGPPESYTHINEHGLQSVTYAGVHLSFTRNFGLSAGYRLVLGLSKSSLGEGRSGTAFGIMIGF